MNPIILIVVGVLYLGVAGQYVINDRPWMALAFAGYAAANLGFIMEAR